MMITQRAIREIKRGTLQRAKLEIERMKRERTITDDTFDKIVTELVLLEGRL